ncbi:hypothetical protein P7K49_024266 [Saguinus oedipus]|uniref:Uncharacterized protein n=1 Tax=Saguinus oedipus TaxID=9490 RepID=A0ABQ9UPT1_SAGOE|nr:hypothetical protein P7K49_024266 [Saguinus oedipus]
MTYNIDVVCIMQCSAFWLQHHISQEFDSMMITLLGVLKSPRYCEGMALSNRRPGADSPMLWQSATQKHLHQQQGKPASAALQHPSETLITMNYCAGQPITGLSDSELHEASREKAPKIQRNILYSGIESHL